MCDCITRIQKELPEKTGSYNGKKVLKASIGSVVFPLDGGKLKMQTTQPLELDLEGRKTPEKTSISHKYCPFCGEEYNQKVESKS